MAAIVITITTAYAQIFDTNGRNGWGTVVVRPSQAFEYTGTASDTFTVTDAAKTVTVEDGVITKVDGVAATTLTLSPSDGASNNPVVYYVVDINVNGTTQRKFWVLDYAASTSVAWSSVQQLPSADDQDSAYNQLINDANPLPQYLLKSDTVDAGTAGTASDGRGYVGRLDSSTGKFPTSMIPNISGTTVSLADAGGYFTTDNAEAALQQIASTSTAFISTARIQNLAVSTDKLAASSVTDAKIGTDAVTAPKVKYGSATKTTSLSAVAYPAVVQAGLFTRGTDFPSTAFIIGASVTGAAAVCSFDGGTNMKSGNPTINVVLSAALVSETMTLYYIDA